MTDPTNNCGAGFGSGMAPDRQRRPPGDGNQAPGSDAAAAATAPRECPEEDRVQVEVGSEELADQWADRFNVTRAQLEEAVSAVGSDEHAVATYLRGQGGGD